MVAQVQYQIPQITVQVAEVVPEQLVEQELAVAAEPVEQDYNQVYQV
jgi:hypothetical protein